MKPESIQQRKKTQLSKITTVAVFLCKGLNQGLPLINSFSFLSHLVPHLKLAEVQIDSYATTVYDGKLRVKVTFLWDKLYQGSDKLINVTVQQHDRHQLHGFELIDVNKFVITEDQARADGEKKDGIFFNAQPSTSYTVLLNRREEHFRNLPGQRFVKAAQRCYFGDQTWRPLVMNFR